jgi:hypothetical protein
MSISALCAQQRLLLFLNETASGTTAGSQAVSDAAAPNAILVTHIATLDCLKDELAASEAVKEVPITALWV